MLTAMLPTLVNRRAVISTCSLCEFRRCIGQNYATKAFNCGSSSQASTFSTQILRRPVQQFRSPRSYVYRSRSLTTNTQDAPGSKPEPIPEYSFSIKFKPKDLKNVGNSQIRQSLQQWSAQNKQSKEKAVPENIPSEGRVTRLPNALFIDAVPEAELATDDDHKMTIDGDADEGFLGPAGRAILPGTLMAHNSLSIRRQDVVYLGDIGVQSLMLLENGTWAAESMASKRDQTSTFRCVPIPGFLTTAEVESLQAHMPKRDVTRALEDGGPSTEIAVTGLFPDDVTAPIIAKLRALKETKDRFRREHKTQLEQMYDTLALDQEWRQIRLRDLPLLVLGIEFADMSDIAKYTFVEHANTFHAFFIAVQTAETITYYIGPKTLNENVREVQEWARMYQEAAAQAAIGKNVSTLLRENPLSSFIDKARRIITKSRQVRPPTNLHFLGSSHYQSVDGSNEKVPSGEVFTSEDKKILSYLYDVGFRRPISRSSKAHAALIARAIGAYPGTNLDTHTTRMLMHELGCVNHWELQDDISLPIPGRGKSRELDQLYDEAARSIAPMIDRETECTTFADSMAHLRKDWGDMEAFCVDRAGTVNIEDAFSLESASEIEGAYWIHSHFSHPTSHLDKDHPLMKMARKRGVAYYDVDENQANTPMFPFEFIKQFSIRKDSPVLTISTLLTKDGRVHDVKIVPAILRNVKHFDRDVVYEAMGIREHVDQAVLVVGKVSKSPEIIRKDGSSQVYKSKQHVDDVSPHLSKLELLMELLTARRECRRREVEMPAYFPRSDFRIDVSTRIPEGTRNDGDFESYHWKADPGVMLTAQRRVDTSLTVDEHRGSDITAQATRLASESCGKWMADRNVPAVFLGNATPAGFSVEQLNKRGHHESPLSAVFLRTSYPNPVIHHNMKQSTACSSPLRIFIDTFNHFQVDSYLKRQADGSLRTDQVVEDDTILAFSRGEVDEYLSQDIFVSDAITHYSMEIRESWIAQALFRAFHFNEAVLPKTMEVLVTTPTKRDARGKLAPALGRLIPWGLQVELEETTEGYERKARVNDFVPIELVSIFPTRRLVLARASGPPNAEQQVLDPIKCYTSDNIVQRSTQLPSTQKYRMRDVAPEHKKS